MNAAEMSVKDLREYVVKPALFRIGLYSLAAENLVIGTARQESRLHYLDQTTSGPGPAYGICQMEKATHDDHWKWLEGSQALRSITSGLYSMLSDWPEKILQLHGNLFYSVAMCRVHYYRKPFKLPENPDDVHALAAIWKQYYNTIKGKGTVDEFVRNYR